MTPQLIQAIAFPRPRISKEFRRGMSLDPLYKRLVTKMWRHFWLTLINCWIRPWNLKSSNHANQQRKYEEDSFNCWFISISNYNQTHIAVLRCGGWPFYFHTYLYSFFIYQISALTQILIIKYPIKIILLQSIHLNYLFILCSRFADLFLFIVKQKVGRWRHVYFE